MTATVATTVDALAVAAYTIPTDEPESDGTLEWDSTTIVVVEVRGGGERGLGYTYSDAAAGMLIESKLVEVACGSDVEAVPATWEAMSRALRNVGRPGLGFMALSAVDTALWDLHARCRGTSLATALGAAHESVPVYGSGGFTSYSLERIAEQLGGWAAEGIPRVKLKIGRSPSEDPARLDAAREAIGDDVELFVDANGAFERRQALDWAERYVADWNVSWFEEPVSSDDLEGLALLRNAVVPGIEIAAGEYGDTPVYFERMLRAGAVDCLQADVTRCGGYTGLLRVAALADAAQIDLSGHCAPQVSVHGLAAVGRLRHLEWFHDHVRLESMLFDGVLEPEDGVLRPDRSRPGNGLELKRKEAGRWAV
ncbi:MAG TPA: enolase C-terminal domain-like protein [Gaiellaceae bacterium]|jgi:L-alanine-DL-glutamate epimerase-like enolase superfamily enzyme